MSRFVALLRAVNVGGTGKLPMTELVAMCKRARFRDVLTYIASGNVVFASELPELKVKRALEAELAAYAGKPVGVLVRTAEEMAAVVAANPFPKAPSNRTVAIFLDSPPPADALKMARGVQDEKMRLGVREIYVHYGDGMARSKLRDPRCAGRHRAKHEHDGEARGAGAWPVTSGCSVEVRDDRRMALLRYAHVDWLEERAS